MNQDEPITARLERLVSKHVRGLPDGGQQVLKLREALHAIPGINTDEGALAMSLMTLEIQSQTTKRSTP